MVRSIIYLLLITFTGAFASDSVDRPIEKKLTSQDKRKHKRKTPPKKSYREYNFDELDAVKEELVKNKDLEGAIRTIERMKPLCKKLIDLERISLEYADVLFESGYYEKAAKEYTDFTKLYPGNVSYEHALYHAIVCSFKCILDAERDQTATKDTLELTKDFLERANIFVAFKDQVLDIQAQCYTRLVESELNIVDFYINRGSYKSAQRRLDNLKKDFLDCIPGIQAPTLEATILVDEIKLAEKQHAPELVIAKRTELETKFPNFNEVVQIAQAKPASSFVNRF